MSTIFLALTPYAFHDEARCYTASDTAQTEVAHWNKDIFQQLATVTVDAAISGLYIDTENLARELC